MKKLSLLIVAIAFIGLSANAQSGFFKRASDGKTTDTLTNSATVNMQLPISGFQNVVSIQPLVTKISGTTAGTLRLYGSLDGTNYVRINATTDSLVLANTAGVQTKIFLVNNSPYAYYQVRVTGTGTESTKVQTYAIWRKE